VRRPGRNVFEVCDELLGLDDVLVAVPRESQSYPFGEGGAGREPESEDVRVDGRSAVSAGLLTLDKGAVTPAFRGRSLILGCALIAGTLAIGLNVLREQSPSAAPGEAKPAQERAGSRAIRGEGGPTSSSATRPGAGRRVRQGLTERKVLVRAAAARRRGSADPVSHTPRATRPAAAARGTSQMQRAEPRNEFSFER
jgi:hypothetical protein